MKNLFEKLISLSNLYDSYYLAYKGRKKSKEVIEYKRNLEENISRVQEKLITFTYKHKKYNTFIAFDSKKRIINAPSFEDHILHHAVFSILEEVFDKKFIFNSYANRKGKGSHIAVLKLQKESRKYNWYLKLDISKYFASVNQGILFEQIKKYVSDEKFLYYVKLIIESFNEPIKQGMPIGNVTSQLFANVYLHDLDFYVENNLKPFFKKQSKKIFYVRYVDDFIFLSDEKEDLIIIRNLVLKFLDEKLKLSVHPRKMILNKIKCGMNFLGYIVFKDRIKVKNESIKRFNKKIKKYPEEKKLHSIISFKGHCDLADINLIKSLSSKILSQEYLSLFCKLNVYKHKKTEILNGTEAGYRSRVQKQGTEAGYRSRVQKQGTEEWLEITYSQFLISASI